MPNETNILLNPNSIILANRLTTDQLTTAQGEISFRRSSQPGTESIIRLFSLLEGFCLYDRLNVVTAEDVTFEKVDFPALPKADMLKTKSKQERRAIRKDFFVSFLKAAGKRILKPAINSIYVTAVTGSPLYKLAREEGIIREITQASVNASIAGTSSDSSTWKTLNELSRTVQNKDTFLWMTLSRLLKFSYLPDFAEAQIIEGSNLSRVVPESEIQKIYNQLSATIKDSLEGLELSAGRPLEFYIPPIPALILEKVSDPENIPEAMMEVRHDLRKVRSALAEYEDIVRDQDATLKDREDARTRLAQITEDATKDQQDRATATAQESTLYGLLKGVAKFEPTGIASFLVDQPFKKLMTTVRNRDVSYLFKLKKKYKNIKSIGKLVHKVFKIDIVQSDIEALEMQPKVLKVTTVMDARA